MCLPKGKAKKHGHRHCRKNVRRLLTTIWQRKAVWKTSFQTNPQELSALCIYPKQLLNSTKNVSIKKTLFISTLAQYFILQLRKNIPLTTMTLIVLCFGKRALERNASTFILWTWGRMLLKGIFLNNFWNLFMLWPMNAIHAITFQSTLKRAVAGMLTGAVLSELAHPYRFGLGFNTTLQGARLENYMVLANNSENSIKVQVWVYKQRSTNCIHIIKLNEHL